MGKIPFDIANGSHQVAGVLTWNEVVGADFEDFAHVVRIVDELDRRVSQKGAIDLRVFVRIDLKLRFQLKGDVNFRTIHFVD